MKDSKELEAEVRRKAYDEAYSEAYKEAFEASRISERLRIAAIVCSDEAKGKYVLAFRIALETRIMPEVARLLLSSSAPETEDSDPWGRFGSAEECELIASTVNLASRRRLQ